MVIQHFGPFSNLVLGKVSLVGISWILKESRDNFRNALLLGLSL